MPGIDDADQLQNIIEDARQWPIWSADNIGGLDIGVYAQAGQYGNSLRDIAMWVAMRESDRDQLKSLIRWGQGKNRDYKVDPLPERISQAFADLLFGEDPRFEAPSPNDQDQLMEMIDANDLPSELRRWALDTSSEGEVWWRIYTDREASAYPIVEGHSRLDVFPLWRGRKIMAVAFFSDIYEQTIKLEQDKYIRKMWRHVEIQATGYVRNLLYEGTNTTLGTIVPLTDRPETENFPEEWNHGLEMVLAGRIPNKLGRDWRLGVSDYAGIRDIILDINEARTIAAENARLAAKKRMIVPASAIRDDGTFDAGEDVITVESLDTDLDNKDQKGPYVILEYNYNAAPLIEHTQDLITTALTRVGLAEQFVNSSSRGTGEGAALSGTALRTRLIPTTLAASGKARFFDDALPKIIHAMMQVSALPVEQFGNGQTWSNTTDAPTVTRSSVLPEDPMEEVTRHVAAVAGEVESVEFAVRELHPDWDDDQVGEELSRIKDDRDIFGIGQKGAAAGGGDGPPAPPDEGNTNTGPLGDGGQNPPGPPNQEGDANA